MKDPRIELVLSVSRACALRHRSRLLPWKEPGLPGTHSERIGHVAIWELLQEFRVGREFLSEVIKSVHKRGCIITRPQELLEFCQMEVKMTLNMKTCNQQRHRDGRAQIYRTTHVSICQGWSLQVLVKGQRENY